MLEKEEAEEWLVIRWSERSFTKRPGNVRIRPMPRQYWNHMTAHESDVLRRLEAEVLAENLTHNQAVLMAGLAVESEA